MQAGAWARTTLVDTLVAPLLNRTGALILKVGFCWPGEDLPDASDCLGGLREHLHNRLVRALRAKACFAFKHSASVPTSCRRGRRVVQGDTWGGQRHCSSGWQPCRASLQLSALPAKQRAAHLPVAVRQEHGRREQVRVVTVGCLLRSVHRAGGCASGDQRQRHNQHPAVAGVPLSACLTGGCTAATSCRGDSHAHPGQAHDMHVQGEAARHAWTP